MFCEGRGFVERGFFELREIIDKVALRIYGFLIFLCEWYKETNRFLFMWFFKRFVIF